MDIKKSDNKLKKYLFICAATVFIILLTAFIAFLIPKNKTWFSYEAVSANIKVSGFLNAVKNQDYEKAFKNLYYYDKSSDLLPEITESEAQKIWTERMAELQKKDIFLSDFKDVKTYTDDGYMKGTVVITLSERGAPRTYKTELFFIKNEGRWKLCDISTEEHLTSFEKAISGYVPWQEN